MANYHVSTAVKNLAFNEDARNQLLSGVIKLSNAVESTMGAGGRPVVIEDDQGGVFITKDGVTVADAVFLRDPVENMGATLIKQAAQNTVKEVGDATSNSTAMARYILEEASKSSDSVRNITDSITIGLDKVVSYLDNVATPITNDLLVNVATISCNNDSELGGIIAESFLKVGGNGVVTIEESETEATYADVVDGVSLDSGLKSKFFITDIDDNTCVLEKPFVLLSMTKIESIRKIQNILEYVVKNGRSLLIIGNVEHNVLKVLATNKVKGHIKVNVIDPIGFGSTKHDSMEDLAILSGGKLVSDELGDDIDSIGIADLGEFEKAVTDDRGTVIKIVEGENIELGERIEQVKKKIKETTNPYIKTKLEGRLSVLSGKVGVVYVGGKSEVEQKERKDRVDDAVHATKAALKEGIVAGGGVALRDASSVLDLNIEGERILHYAINKQLEIIMKNAGFTDDDVSQVRQAEEGYGMNVLTGDVVDMIEDGVIDPLLVVKTALKNATSVSSTILSSNCVLSNQRVEDYK